jgi:hypothetical protein
MLALMSLGYILLGLVLTILGMWLMFFLIRSYYPNSKFNIQSFIIGFILFFFLSFQITCMIGAIAIKSMTDEINMTIKTIHPRILE